MNRREAEDAHRRAQQSVSFCVSSLRISEPWSARQLTRAPDHHGDADDLIRERGTNL
jgi:hypothetical protein